MEPMHDGGVWVVGWHYALCIMHYVYVVHVIKTFKLKFGYEIWNMEVVCVCVSIIYSL